MFCHVSAFSAKTMFTFAHSVLIYAHIPGILFPSLSGHSFRLKMEDQHHIIGYIIMDYSDTP